MFKIKFLIIFLIVLTNIEKSISQIFKNDSLIREGDIYELVQFSDSLNWVTGVINNTNFPDSIKTALLKSKIEYLDIWSFNLEEIPNEIGEVKTLKYLSIGGKFNQLPKNINQLQSLQALVIPNSLLTNFEIKLPLLKVLTIVSDSIIHLNTEFSKNLNYMAISSKEVDLNLKCLCNLKNLIYLEIYFLKNSEVPKCLRRLKNLEYMGISADLNRKNIYTLSKLKHMKFLVFHKTEEIPDNLTKLSFLEGISFGKTLLKDEIEAINKYLPHTTILSSKELKGVSDSYYFKYHK